MEEQIKKVKKVKNYYKEDPTWRLKHLENMAQQKHCDICNKTVTTGNLKRHCKSSIHMRNVQSKSDNKVNLAKLTILTELKHSLERPFSQEEIIKLIENMINNIAE